MKQSAKKYPIARPHITKGEERSVLGILRSGKLSLGPIHKIFEKKFAEKIGTKFACSVLSGTAGLHLAMIAADIKPGDEVITSPFSLHLFSFYKKMFGYKNGDFPITEEVSRLSLALPFYIGLKDKDIKHISNKLIKTLEIQKNE